MTGAIDFATLQTLIEMYARINSSNSDEDALMALVLESAMRLIHCESSSLFLLKSPVIVDLLHVLEEVAKTNSSVLITGESGVGKELFAEQLHLKSSRANKPFIRVNCASLSASLLERVLFGHVTDAPSQGLAEHEGCLEAADGGTLFLDEIGELPLNLQAKLLRVMQEHAFERIASGKTIAVDVRVLASTSRDLEKMTSEGTFRSDLFYRLNVLPLHVPPLRERTDDIEPLASFFLKKYSVETKKNFTGFSAQAMRRLYDYYWPGNIRELKNSVERACLLGRPPVIQVEDLHLASTPASLASARDDDSFDVLADETLDSSSGDRTLKTALTKFKTAYVKRILKETSWNQTEAGKILGIQRTYVSRLLNELHIR